MTGAATETAGSAGQDRIPTTAAGRKAYYVERPARTVTTILVYADTAAEVVEVAAQGGGEAIDSQTVSVGRGRARRSPEDDDA